MPSLAEVIAITREIEMKQIVIGVNDPKPAEKPKKGFFWIRMKGGPQDGQWVQVAI